MNEWVEAIRLEAIAIWVEAIASRLEAIAISSSNEVVFKTNLIRGLKPPRSVLEAADRTSSRLNRVRSSGT